MDNEFEKIKDNNKKRMTFLLLTIILSLGISLAAVYFVYQYRDSRENKIATGLISIDFNDGSEVINLDKTVPVIDDVGITNTPYTFTVTNTSSVPINAKIMLDVDNQTTINLGAVRYALYIDDELIKKDYVHEDDLTLYTYNNMSAGKVLNCKLVFWIDYYYETSNEKFVAKVKAEGESFDIIADNRYIVTFEMNGGIDNLMYGLDDITNQMDGYNFMKYSVSNKVVTVTALRPGGDSWGFTNGKVDLEIGKTYIFSCDTTGTWGANGSDTVEAYFQLDGINYNPIVRMASNNNYEFTVPQSGTYHLRLDVNQENAEYSFSNIKVLEKNPSKEVGYNDLYGTLPEPTRTGYTFKGWYLEEEYVNEITSTSTVSTKDNHTLYSKWQED